MYSAYSLMGTLFVFQYEFSEIGAERKRSSSIGWVVVNRLMLNLKRTSYNHELNTFPDYTTITGLPEPYFASNSFLGNLGAPLRVGTEYNEEDNNADGGVSVGNSSGEGDYQLTIVAPNSTEEA